MSGKAWVPGDHVHLAHGVINGLQLMLALFKVEGFCENDKRIRKLNILLYMGVNKNSTRVLDMLSCPL